MQKAGVMNFEMEAATLFTMSTLFKKRAGAICFVVANRVTDEFAITEDMAVRAGNVATRAVELLYQWDQIKLNKHKSLLYPDLFK